MSGLPTGLRVNRLDCTVSPTTPLLLCILDEIIIETLMYMRLNETQRKRKWEIKLSSVDMMCLRCEIPTFFIIDEYNCMYICVANSLHKSRWENESHRRRLAYFWLALKRKMFNTCGPHRLEWESENLWYVLVISWIFQQLFFPWVKKWKEHIIHFQLWHDWFASLLPSHFCKFVRKLFTKADFCEI